MDEFYVFISNSLVGVGYVLRTFGVALENMLVRVVVRFNFESYFGMTQIDAVD